MPDYDSIRGFSRGYSPAAYNPTSYQSTVEDFSPLPGYSPSGSNTNFLTMPGINDNLDVLNSIGGGNDVGGLSGIFKDLGGLGGMGQLASGVGSIFSAMNAGDQLDEAKRQAGVAEQYASLNAFNSGQQVNTGLRDRQRSRVMSQGLPQGDSGKYQSVKSYMDQNKVRTGV